MIIDSKLVKNIINAAFPDCNKKQATINVSEKCDFGGNYWDSGCKNYYSLVELNTLRVLPIPDDNPLRNINTNIYDMKPGIVVVKRSYFGMREYITIISHPANMQLNISQQKVDLSDDEKCVLYFTSKYKASYAGLSNYRFHECKRFNGISLENWEKAKLSLIEMKYLNKAGALTISGKNIVGTLTEDYATKTIKCKVKK